MASAVELISCVSSARLGSQIINSLAERDRLLLIQNLRIAETGTIPANRRKSFVQAHQQKIIPTIRDQRVDRGARDLLKAWLDAQGVELGLSDMRRSQIALRVAEHWRDLCPWKSRLALGAMAVLVKGAAAPLARMCELGSDAFQSEVDSDFEEATTEARRWLDRHSAQPGEGTLEGRAADTPDGSLAIESWLGDLDAWRLARREEAACVDGIARALASEAQEVPTFDVTALERLATSARTLRERLIGWAEGLSLDLPEVEMSPESLGRAYASLAAQEKELAGKRSQAIAMATALSAALKIAPKRKGDDADLGRFQAEVRAALGRLNDGRLDDTDARLAEQARLLHAVVVCDRAVDSFTDTCDAAREAGLAQPLLLNAATGHYVDVAGQSGARPVASDNPSPGLEPEITGGSAIPFGEPEPLDAAAKSAVPEPTGGFELPIPPDPAGGTQGPAESDPPRGSEADSASQVPESDDHGAHCAAVATLSRPFGADAVLERRISKAEPDLAELLLSVRGLPYAYWLAKWNAPSPPGLGLTASSLEALVLARSIRAAEGSNARRLAEIMQETVNAASTGEERSLGEKAVLWASAVPAILLAPSTCEAAQYLLYDVPTDLKVVAQLHTELLSVSERHGSLLSALLDDKQQSVSYEHDCEAYAQDARELLKLCATMHTAAGKVKDALIPLTQPNGPINRLLDPIVRQDVGVLAQWHSELEAFPAVIEETLQSGPLAGQPHTLRTFVKSRLEKVLKLARQWSELHHNAPPARDELAEDLEGIRLLVSGARAEILDSQAIAGARTDRCGLKLYAGVLDDIADMLRLQRLPAAHPESLGDALLRVPSLDLGVEAGQDAANAEALLSWLADPTWDWGSCFQRHVEAANFEAAGYITERFLPPDEQRDQELRAAVSTERDRLDVRIAALRDQIQTAAQFEYISQETLEYLQQCLSQIPPQRSNFAAAWRVIQRVEQDLEDAQADRNARLRRRVSDLRGDSHDPFRERQIGIIESALARHDLAVADELLVLLERGTPFPESPPPEPVVGFEPFIDAFLPAAEALFSQKGYLETCLEAFKTGGYPVEVPSLTLGGDDSQQLLDNWLRLRESQALDKRLDALKSLLTRLGFEVGTLQPDEFRSRSPRAGGTLRLHLAGSRDGIPPYSARSKPYLVRAIAPADTGIIAQLAVEDRSLETPCLFLVFGRLSRADREELARQFKARGAGPIVLDEALLVYLAGVRPVDRNAALFSIALAHGRHNPYAPHAFRSLSQQMFYGRGEETHQLLLPEGPCTVYGGRQLGKSTLLENVRRHFLQSREPGLCLLEEIQELGATEDHPIEEIWRRLGELLCKEGKIPSIPNPTAKNVCNAIEGWLIERQPDDRCLLLLDEADEFLSSDAEKGFENVAAFRRLMGNTQRRFKVVFSGLHRVQRFNHIPNQPLVHFGSPLKVGPLPAHDAVRLVRDPLLDLGFRFAEGEAGVRQIARILASTNYHPMLIQLFCRSLVDSLHQRLAEGRGGFPLTVLDRDIDHVYAQKELRAELNMRFELTIRLDERYAILANVIADRHYQRRDPGHPIYSELDILDHALRYWPVAYGPLTLENVESLLQEMEDLGLLSRRAGGYHLRNENILRLLGRPEKIRHKLETSRGLRPIERCDQTSYRRKASEDSEHRSVLTSAQERAFMQDRNQLHLLFGSEAHGLKELEASLRSIVGVASVEVLARCKDDAALLDSFRAKIRSQQGSHGIILVQAADISSKLGRDIVLADLAAQLRKQTASNRFTHGVVVFSPADSFRWLTLPAEERQQLERQEGAFHCLQRWAEPMLRSWLLGFQSPHPTAQAYEATGGWQFLLNRCLKPGTRKQPYPDFAPEAAAAFMDVGKKGPDWWYALTGGALDRDQEYGNRPEGNAAREVLSLLCELEGYPVSQSDVLEELRRQQFKHETVESAIEWLVRHGLVDLSRDCLQVAPCVAGLRPLWEAE